MSLALFSAYRLLNPLQQMARGFLPSPSHVSAPMPRSIPLRVSRVMESQQPRHSAGRMVISGRMADVCAELDRLAQNEVTH
jgi:hypothetical protein